MNANFKTPAKGWDVTFSFGALSLLCLCLLVGCQGPRYPDYFSHFDNGLPKPKVLLLPIKNTSFCAMPNDPSGMLTERLRYWFLVGEALYLYSETQSAVAAEKLQDVDLFGKNLDFVNRFKGVDFIIVCELIGHEADFNRPERSFGCLPCTKVNYDLRVRIIDVRNQCPSIVLQESFTRAHQVKTKMLQEDALNVSSFYVDRTARDLACRIQKAIWSFR